MIEKKTDVIYGRVACSRRSDGGEGSKENCDARAGVIVGRLISELL